MTAARLWDWKGIVAVLDTSTLVSARLSKDRTGSPTREVVRLAGALYDSFTSPAILDEVETVLERPRFGISREETRVWIDVFVRHSRQVDPAIIPGDLAKVLGDDQKDNPILKTAFAVHLHEEGQPAVTVARHAGGWFVVSLDSDFTPGWNVFGWEFIRPREFLNRLRET